MPDFDFLSDLDSNKPDDSKKPADAGPAAKKNEKFDLDLSFLDEPKTASEQAAEAVSAEADLFGEAVGPAAGDAAESDTSREISAADDPLADALSELDIEASPAATYEPTPDMSADTTGALSEDSPFADDAFGDFLVGDDKPAAAEAPPSDIAAAGGDAEILDFGAAPEATTVSEFVDEIAPLRDSWNRAAVAAKAWLQAHPEVCRPRKFDPGLFERFHQDQDDVEDKDDYRS